MKKSQRLYRAATAWWIVAGGWAGIGIALGIPGIGDLEVAAMIVITAGIVAVLTGCQADMAKEEGE